MSLVLLIDWAVMLTVTAVAGRVLGRAKGFGVGLLCAGLWITVVLGEPAGQVAPALWRPVCLAAGAACMLLMA